MFWGCVIAERMKMKSFFEKHSACRGQTVGNTHQIIGFPEWIGKQFM